MTREKQGFERMGCRQKKPFAISRLHPGAKNRGDSLRLFVGKFRPATLMKTVVRHLHRRTTNQFPAARRIELKQPSERRQFGNYPAFEHRRARRSSPRRLCLGGGVSQQCEN